MRFSILLILAYSALLLSCNDSEDPIDPSVATYDVTFTFTWSQDNFPVEYPSNPHFSRLIGWSHSNTTEFFQEGTIASPGIRQMAETGGPSILSNEIEDRIAAGEGIHLVSGSGLGDGVGEISIVVDVTAEYPSVTLATMIAPSPDWYVAVVNINLTESGEFVSSRTIEAGSYDAGTDSGNSYNSSNQATTPPEAIQVITDAPLGDGTGVSPALATVTFTRR